MVKDIVQELIVKNFLKIFFYSNNLYIFVDT